MLTGQKGFNHDVKEVSSSIIIEKCNSRETNHELTICDFTNWIIDRFDSLAGKKYVTKVLNSKGFSVCKKSEATHYAILTQKGSDISELNLWLFYSEP